MHIRGFDKGLYSGTRHGAIPHDLMMVYQHVFGHFDNDADYLFREMV